MGTSAAVGVDDDLAAGQTAVALRAADFEAAGRVDVEDGLLVDQLGRDGLLGHRDQILADGRELHLGLVLGADHHGVHAHRLAVVVLDGDLALGVGAQVGQLLLLAQPWSARPAACARGQSAAASGRGSRRRRSRTSGPGRRRPAPCAGLRLRSRPGRCQGSGGRG